MAKYKLSNQAKEDHIRIYQFDAHKFGSTQAKIYFNTFFEYFAFIAQSPSMCEAVDYIKPGYRRCVCGVDSIFYCLKNDEVEIMAIIGRHDIDLIF